MTEPTKTPTLTALDLAVAAAMNLVWGLNIVAVKMSTGVSEPFTVGVLRLGLVAVLCVPALRWVPGRMGWLVLLGVLNGAVFLVFTNLSLSLARNVSAIAVASQLGVPFTLLLAVVVMKERIHWPRILGVALAFAGVTGMLFDPRIVDDAAALGAATVAAFTWACGSLIQRKLAGVPVLTIYAWLGTVGCAAMLPLAWWAEPAAMRAVPDIRLGGFGWIAFSALGSTLIGQGSMAWLLARHPIGTVSPLTLASPVVAVAASAWFFAQPLTAPMIAGGVVALAGVAVITLRSARAAR